MNTTSIAARPAWTVQQLDELDYTAKLRHWMRPDAWEPGGHRLYFRNPEVNRSSIIMKEGHIEAMRPLVGRPCFGIATAYLRYKDQVRFIKGRGFQPTGRCASCKAQEACASVVTRRLQANSSIDSAWSDWLKADGPMAFRMPNYDTSLAQRLWNTLCRELMKHPFNSCNDAAIAKHYEESHRERLEKDRLRQTANRKKDRRQGIVDDVDLALLAQAAGRRHLGLTLARIHPNCPKALSRLPDASVTELVEVWLGREVMRLSKEKPNAPNIARWIVAEGKSNKSQNHAALATRVDKDLKRIISFELLAWDDSVLLPPLDSAVELPADHAGTPTIVTP